MELYCDGERVFLSRNYRVEGIAKKSFLERSDINVVWQSEKLSETPVKLTNTRYQIPPDRGWRKQAVQDRPQER